MSSHKRILWSANDPGGMNAIMPVISALVARGDIIVGLATGPAVAMAKQKEIAVKNATAYSDAELLEKINAVRPDVFLAGSSSGNSIDKKIFRLIPHVPSVYVLDFWSNYRMRFSADGDDLKYSPTAICIIDELARNEMLAAGFEDSRLHVTGNPHTEHFIEDITRDRENAHELVFISQPIREVDGGKYGFDEHLVLGHLIRAVQKMPEPFHLRIRLHPKDERHKFDGLLGGRVSMSPAHSLEESLSTAGLVVGMFSPVLIQAATSGKRVLSYEPCLTGEDPLITNRLGLTKKLTTELELNEALGKYAEGESHATALDVNKLWPKGAVGRILQVIDSLVPPRA
ncbi:hypothetical protein HYT04_00980 [Candidatus Kaiserbacteria bacterium]|nr:hypothetical protein [Candidatus Kaiserbacteria bacterium]